MRFYFCFILITIVCLFSSCQAVSEESSPLPEYSAGYNTSDINVTEEYTTAASTASEKHTKAEPITDGSDQTSAADTAASADPASDTTASLPEISDTEAATSQTSAPPAEVQTAEQQSSSALTLQYESPRVSEYDLPEKPSEHGGRSYKALNFSEQKGFWITYLEYASMLKNRSEDSFRKAIGECFDNIAGLGFNTVYVQVRAFGDAYYDSELFPSGEQYSGTIGSGSSFDALETMIQEAHERGLSIHAWVNPMRLMTSSQIQGISDKFTIKKWYDSDDLNGTYIVKSGDRWYLSPAYSEVTDLIADGISEIVSNYDVDGIQIDDYFYPTTDSSFDSAAYSSSGTSLSLSDWRISNVNKMVRKLYKAVHSANPTAVFGISPQGSIENDYSEAYADVRSWCSESGYCDYILPQVYFGFSNAALPYADVISVWDGMIGNSGVKLVIGLAAYKIGAEDSYAGAKGRNEWIDSSDIISRQMKLAEALGNYGGVALYRYDSVFRPSSDVAEQVSKEIKNIEK